MESQYPQQYEFRLKIASLTLDPLWMGRVGRVILPDYFETDAEQEVVRAIYDYKDKYGKLPRDPEDISAMCTDPAADDIVYQIFEYRYGDYDMDMPKDVAIQWAKEQSVKIAILESIDDVKKGNLRAPLERMELAVAIGEDILPPGIDLVEDIDQWLYTLWTDKVCTGWHHMDAHLDGGLGAGELGIILAPTNRGKSVALVNIAVAAAGMGSNKNVLVATHEMKAELYAKRMAARIMFRFPNRYGKLNEYENEFLELAAKLIPGSIKVIGGPRRMGVHDLEDEVNRLMDDGWKPDIIIDDYADLLVPPRTYGELRHELTSTYKWLREYGGELGCPIWTASQVGRAAYSKEVIRTEHIAEDIGKANTADVIVAICQTEEEARKRRCRLFMPKVRDAKHGKMYDAKYYTDAQAIITIGETKMLDEEDVM